MRIVSFLTERRKVMTAHYRYVRGAATLLVLTAMTVLHAAAPAHASGASRPSTGATGLAATCGAASNVSWWYIKNAKTKYVLGVSGSNPANGTAIIQFHKVAHLQDQAWTLWQASDGYFVLRNALTSSWKAIGMNASGTGNGVKAIEWDCKPGLLDQEWYPTVHGDGTWEFKNQNSQRCLAIPGGSTVEKTQAVQWDCLGISDQTWI